MEEEKFGPYRFLMLGLCLYVLLALGAETFFDLDEDTRYILKRLDFLICLLFLSDFFWTLATSNNRIKYLVTWGWIDFLSSIPSVAFLRWGRVARVLRIFRMLRAVRAAKVVSTFMVEKRAESALAIATLLSLLVTTFGSIAILHFETHPDSNILNGGDALWWSFVTITTVGYGDLYPVTLEGRVIAGFLMSLGVGLFGTFTALFAKWFLDPEEAKETEILRTEIRELRRAIEDLSRRGPVGWREEEGYSEFYAQRERDFEETDRELAPLHHKPTGG